MREGEFVRVANTGVTRARFLKSLQSSVKEAGRFLRGGGILTAAREAKKGRSAAEAWRHGEERGGVWEDEDERAKIMAHDTELVS
jgi:hypothetical protein